MHMHATSCDGTFQKALARKIGFAVQWRRCWPCGISNCVYALL